MLVGFLFLVALGVDYNIFLVPRIRQEASRPALAVGRALWWPSRLPRGSCGANLHE